MRYIFVHFMCTGVKTGSIFKIAIRLLDIREAHKKHINVAQLHCLISHKFVMPKLEGDGGENRVNFKIAIRLLDIRKAHENYTNLL